MIKFTVLSIRNPQWSSKDCSSIDCLIRSNTLIDEVPFTASKHDSELNGREIYEKCLSGEFGEIAPMESREAGLKAHPELPREYQHLQRFLSAVNSENSKKSFRSVVIVWASMLDNLLDQMIENDASTM